MIYDIIATTAFGIESVTSRELKDLGYSDVQVSNGRIDLKGTSYDIAKLNMWLRTADRILIKLSTFKASTFEELFQGVKSIPWGDILPINANMHVVGKSVASTLHSVPDCQSITKKAIIDCMQSHYGISQFEEDGSEYKISVSILKDIVDITLDTSGLGLHKRGYRRLAGQAPLKETLACALLLLSYWKGNRILVDPLCGSGTIPIEAAMIASNKAPGKDRVFSGENFDFIEKESWNKVRLQADELYNPNAEINIYGSDIDPKAIELANHHAEESGMDEFIHLKQMNVRDFISKDEYGFIVTNPPYGERLGEEKQVLNLYKDMGRTFQKLNTWSYYIISSNVEFEQCFGKKADKRRKLYNGRIECQYYQYLGPKPKNHK